MNIYWFALSLIGVFLISAGVGLNAIHPFYPITGTIIGTICFILIGYVPQKTSTNY